MGVQGIDSARFQFQKKFKIKFTYRWIYRLMKFFQISSYYENECHIENTDKGYLSFKEKHVESTRFFFWTKENK